MRYTTLFCPKSDLLLLDDLMSNSFCLVPNIKGLRDGRHLKGHPDQAPKPRAAGLFPKFLLVLWRLLKCFLVIALRTVYKTGSFGFGFFLVLKKHCLLVIGC